MVMSDWELRKLSVYHLMIPSQCPANLPQAVCWNMLMKMRLIELYRRISDSTNVCYSPNEE